MPNQIIHSSESGQSFIVLNHGRFAKVDTENIQTLACHYWFATKQKTHGAIQWTWYATANVGGKQIRMHVFLMGREDGRVVDHKNGDTLDNRRENLRFATATQNGGNQRPRAGGSSSFKGVSWSKERQKWSAKIMVDRKTKSLGRFDNEEDAARAYDTAAKEAWGDFAWLNFPCPAMEPIA